MPTRQELLDHLWSQIINSQMDAQGLMRVVAAARSRPDEPFADAGHALERLLASGANVLDLCLVQRFASYEAVFGTLYAIGDPGVDGDDVFGLYEDLLTADPSGMEGRPGSAPKE